MQTVGKTYFARPDNIAKYTDRRFNPRDLAKHAPPLEGRPNPPAGPVPVGDTINPSARSGLLLTDENLPPGWLLDKITPVATVTLSKTADRSPLTVAHMATDFAAQASENTALRFTYSFGTPVAEIVEVVDEDGEIRISKCWIAYDVGTALDPGIIEARMVSGAIYGLSAAVMGEITFTDGGVDQWNYPDYDALRMHTAPVFETRILESGLEIGGVGEPGTPLSMPALGNAFTT